MRAVQQKRKQSQRMMCCDCRLFVVCAVGSVRYLIRVGCEDKSTAKSVNSVLQSLSLGFAEPAPFTQGSRNKILYCDKNPLLNFIQTSRADDIRPYRIVLIYNIVRSPIIDIHTDSPSYGRTIAAAHFNFFSRRMPLYGPSVQVPAGTKPKFS